MFWGENAVFGQRLFVALGDNPFFTWMNILYWALFDVWMNDQNLLPRTSLSEAPSPLFGIKAGFIDIFLSKTSFKPSRYVSSLWKKQKSLAGGILTAVLEIRYLRGSYIRSGFGYIVWIHLDTRFWYIIWPEGYWLQFLRSEAFAAVT